MNEVTFQYRVEVLRTPEEVGAIREFWNSCRPGRDADLDFFLLIVDALPEALRPHVMVLYDRHSPKALLVGRLDVGRMRVKLGYFTLPLPKLKVMRFVHGGCLGDVDDTGAELLVNSIISSLAAGEADAAIFEQLDLGSPLVRCASYLPRWFCADYVLTPEIHWMRDLSGETGPFLTRMSRNARHQQKSRASKLAEDFRSNRIETFSTSNDLARLMRDAETVAGKSYQRRLGVGFSETSFIRRRLEFEAQKGWLRACVLYLDDQPRAFWIGSLRNGVFISDYLAFDPAYARYRPGVYLTVKAIEELCDELSGGTRAVERIDFGGGDASYKERLSNCRCVQTRVHIFAPRVKPVWVNFVRSAVGVISHSVKALVGMTPLLGKLKRIWRKRLTERG